LPNSYLRLCPNRPEAVIPVEVLPLVFVPCGSECGEGSEGLARGRDELAGVVTYSTPGEDGSVVYIELGATSSAD
jgi:hypothetical protein